MSPARQPTIERLERTSDYLKKALHSRDGSVLVVGPGLWTNGYRKEMGFPMDTGLLWILESLKESGRRVDVIDLPTQDDAGGSHDPNKLEDYLLRLQEKRLVGNFDILRGNVEYFDFEPREYGIIWDHGALLWAMQGTSQTRDPPKRMKERIERILTNYARGLKEDGAIAIAGFDEAALEVNGIKLPPKLDYRWVVVNRDQYQTAFTSNDLGLIETVPSKGLEPYYKKRAIAELVHTESSIDNLVMPFPGTRRPAIFP